MRPRAGSTTRTRTEAAEVIAPLTLLLATGTNSIRFALWKSQRIAHGRIMRIGARGAFFEIQTKEEPYAESVRVDTFRSSLRALIEYFHRNGLITRLDDIKAVVYRLEYGPPRPVVVSLHDQGVWSALVAASGAHPEMRHTLALIDAGVRQLPALHIAVGDNICACQGRAVHDAARDAARTLSPKSRRVVSVHEGHVPSVVGYYDGEPVYGHEERPRPDRLRDLVRGAQAGDARSVDQLMRESIALAEHVLQALAHTGGLDCIVFSGVPFMVREEVCRRLAWLGIVVRIRKEPRTSKLESTPRSRVAIVCASVTEEQALLQTGRELWRLRARTDRRSRTIIRDL
jgi:acetate kinase